MGTTNRLLLNLKDLLRQWVSLPDGLVLAGVICQALFFTIYLSQKYDFYRTGYFDFGSAVQTSWLASKGYFTALAIGRPITLVASALFVLYPQPQTLLAFQSFALASGGIPIYLLANRQLSNKWYAAGFAFIYLIFPALWGVDQYEYHDLAFCVPFLAFAAYFYSASRLRPFVAAFVLSLASNPFIVIIGLALGFSLLIDRHNVTQSQGMRFALATLGCTVLFAAYLQIAPLSLSYPFATLGPATYTLSGSTSYLNPLALIADPINSLLYAGPQKSFYLMSLFSPFLFLPALAARKFLPGVPWLFVVIMYSPKVGLGIPYEYSQWSSFLIPFVVIASIYGLRRCFASKRFKSQSIIKGKYVIVAMIAVTILVATFTSGLSPLGKAEILSTGDSTVPTNIDPNSPIHGIWPSPVQNYATLDWFVSQIPSNYTVLTQNQIGSKLGERFGPVYVFYQTHYVNTYTDAILVDTNLEGLCATCLASLLSSGSYRLYLSYDEGGIFLYYRIR